MKYIIEMPDDAQYILINGAAENHCYTRVEQVDNLEELNSDYINEHYGQLQDEAYQAGLNDAWEAAKKIIRMPDGDILDLFPDCYASVCTAVQAILKYDASEAIAKLRAYEGKHSDRIEVGDEVQAPRGKAIVTAVKDDFVHYFYSDGDIGFIEPHYVTKTGKHYDIASILEAMRTHD